MTIDLDDPEAEVLREILAAALDQLHVESNHADIRAFRRVLRNREHVVEGLIAKLLEDETRARTA